MSTIVKEQQRYGFNGIGDWLSHNWFPIFLGVYGLWVFTPFLAPVFMNLGWTDAGKATYFFYSFFCHQLPERSFFFFGNKSMYSLAEIQSAWQETANPMILRQFVGNETMGWKVAWSDRMVSFYTSIWFFAALWYPIRRRIKTLRWLGFVMLLLPLIIDGSTHMLSDLAGIGLGFRDSNQWLAILTNNSLSADFYAGDALGSFNSLMRFITGLLAGLGIVWLAFPFIFQTQALNQELEKYDYGKIIEQIKREDPGPSGG
jgi:uncharacterized membrane protein